MKILLFVGGDGTARDVLEAVNMNLPCLGIPAGVKVFSSVFSMSPKKASRLLIQFLWDEIPLKESEVLDIDEEEYRSGFLVSKPYGHLLTPHDPDFSQPSKMGTPQSDLSNQERIAKRVVELLEEDVQYLIGPGTTMKAITDRLNQEKSVLGVDLLRNGRIIAKDLNEREILDHLSERNGEAKIIVSVIGKQGFLFGRGSLQFTPKVWRMVGTKNIIIACTKYKLQHIPGRVLRLDTREPDLDEKMRGLYKIITDYDAIQICKVE